MPQVAPVSIIQSAEAVNLGLQANVSANIPSTATPVSLCPATVIQQFPLQSNICQPYTV